MQQIKRKAICRYARYYLYCLFGFKVYFKQNKIHSKTLEEHPRSRVEYAYADVQKFWDKGASDNRNRTQDENSFS